MTNGPSFSANTESGNITQAMEVDQSTGKQVNNITGNNAQVSQTNNIGEDAWEPVDEAVLAEVPEDQQEAVSDAVTQLKDMVETEQPESEYTGILEVLKPYKGVAKAIASVTAKTVAGPILGPALGKIIDAA